MKRMAAWSVVASAAACGGGTPDAPPDAGAVPGAYSHTFPDVTVEAGQEIDELCMSWTVGNAELLYVNAVEFTAGPGWHHSNWFYVRDSAYPGPDGAWPCEERGFDQQAAAAGGGVLFAQSTQAVAETQAFRPGAAIVLPEGARIVGATHALNAGDAAVTTAMQMTLRTIPYQEATTILHAFSLEYLPLEIPPMARSRFSVFCDLAAKLDPQPVEFSFHYVLPHYHGLGTGMTIDVVGGPRDGQALFTTGVDIGDPGGQRLDPPFDMTGATGVVVSCEFDNPGAETVGWGIGDQEMCIFLAYTDSEYVWQGGARDSNRMVGVSADGVVLHEADCDYLYLNTPLF